MRLRAKDSNISGSSISDHFVEKGASAADIIKRMHPDYLSQVTLLFSAICFLPILPPCCSRLSQSTSCRLQPSCLL